MSLIVQKFGGSLLSSTEKIIRIAKKIFKTYREGNDIVVIVSAMGDETDRLIELVKSISNTPCDREYDVLISSGEQISCALLSMALIDLGCPACSYLGWQIGIRTNSSNKSAEIIQIDTALLEANIAQRRVSIIAGFQGIDEKNNITTLGRGGSDATAVAIASSLYAEVCQIYTDVDGVYTADPQLANNAYKFSKISYNQMLELSDAGAQVVQPYAVAIAKKHSVKLEVASGNGNGNNGTLISSSTHQLDNAQLLGISVRQNNSMLSMEFSLNQSDFISKLFDTLKQKQVRFFILENNISQIYQTGILVFVVDNNDYITSLEYLNNYIKHRDLVSFRANDNISIINFVGIKREYLTSTLSLIKNIITRENIEIFYMKADGLLITLAINRNALKNIINIFCNELGLTEK